MIEIHFERLRTLGLTPALANRAAATAAACEDGAGGSGELQLLRLVEVHRETVRLHDGANEHRARVLPRLTRALDAAESALAVGDWVIAAVDDQRQTWVRERVPPLSHIVRRDTDGRRHPVVSNVDTALLVMGLDEDFNPRRLERYLALLLATSGDVGDVLPVVVLTKADLIARTPGLLGQRLAALHGRVPAHIELLAVDGTDPQTALRLAAYLGAGQTLVVLGSSGAGKSTLTNTLLGRAAQDTGEVRENDGRGKHTTSSRSLHCLPGGACVIDTPGLRTLRPDADAAALTASFGDIEALAAHCRFRDCRHHDEPGCAVREGVAGDRLRNYHKLLREARRDTISVFERQQQVAQWKARGKASRERIRSKRDAG